MSKKLMRLAGAAAVLLAYGGVAGAAWAEDFPATPLQAGAPRDLPGERLIPGAQEAVDLINGVTQPILQPILAPGGDAAAAGPAPAAHHGHHHHHHHVAAHSHLHSHHVAARRGHHKLG